MGQFLSPAALLRRVAAVGAASVLAANISVSGVRMLVEKVSPTVAIQGEKIWEIKSASGSSVYATGSGKLVFSGALIGDITTDIGWNVVAGADTACNTTCSHGCVFGVNTAATEADIVDCRDATADECLCAGPN